MEVKTLMIRELHKSKNLFDKTSWDNVTATRGTVDVVANGIKLTATGNDAYTQTYGNAEYSYPVTAGETYTLSWDIDNPNVYGIVYLFSGSTTGDTVLTNVVASTKTATFTIPNGHQYLSFRLGVSSSGDTLTYTNLMLNTGSTALPYEPYEPYGDTWNTKSYAKIVDTTQQVTSFPVVVRPMENTIPSYTIKGNMVQDGTPSPSNIIYPSETGERTGNLFDITAFVQGIVPNRCTTSYDSTTNTLTINSTGADAHTGNANSYHIPVTGSETYTLSWNTNAVSGQMYIFENGLTDSSHLHDWNSSLKQISITMRSDTTFIIVRLGCNQVNVVKTYSDLMLNTGSAPLPYEPYGYVLPVKSGNTTTPVYLGQVQSTRNVYKYELTGSEPWELHPLYVNLFRISSITDYMHIEYNLSRCSHYKGTNSVTGAAAVINKQAAFYYNPSSPSSSVFYIKDTTFSTAADFKTYLQQQYAAGSPVTIWYVLATPQTGVVNEPIRKIGTYADSVSGTNLSVTAQSPTTIDVDTSLKPSEMDLTYTGTKMCKRKKRVNGAWV
jgi:hypothetical protein